MQELKDKFGMVVRLLNEAAKHRTHNNHKGFTTSVNNLKSQIPCLQKLAKQAGVDKTAQEAVEQHFSLLGTQTTALVKAIPASKAAILKASVPNELINKLYGSVSDLQKTFFPKPLSAS